MNTLHDLAQAIDGRLLSADATRDGTTVPVGRIVIDSRQVEPGDLFWALKGPNHDGADFVGEAFHRGAVAVVAAKRADVPDGHRAVEVDDTYRALYQWARFKRRQFTGTVIAVTGSVGKTTTRQMIHTVLRTRLTGTASPRNYNNHIGLPMSMFAIEPDHHYAVLELGASRPGEIAALAELCAPKVGVVTQIADVHLSGFGSRQAIADAKAELLAALPSEGRAVLGDDVQLRNVANMCDAQIIWVGADQTCDVRAVRVKSKAGRLTFRVVIRNAAEHAEPATASHSTVGPEFCVPVWGRHHVTSALAAVAVGRMMGLELSEMAEALKRFQPVPMRCEVLEMRGATVINDTYNSNPTAMRAALELIRDFDASGRRIVVSGDMAELGRESIASHWRLGKETVSLGGAELLIACGRFARHVVAGARAAGMPHARAVPCETADDALPYLGQAIQPGDVVLVKGSRNMAMERVIEALERFPERRRGA